MSTIKDSAIRALKAEADSIYGLVDQLTDDFDNAVRAILACQGKVVVTGMGKSGIIARKLAATLASTGTSAFFLHPGEAYHGDLGMVEKKDVVLALSTSGFTDEVLKLIPFIEDNGNIIISITGNPSSTLAKHSTYHLQATVKSEACPLDLAPTSSTTALLAMGDALAIALMDAREFRAEDFARFHPGGSLGRRLLTKVADVMRSENLPVVGPGTKLSDAIITISDARMGVAVIMENDEIKGLVTDGDVRRAMLKYQQRFFDVTVDEVMTRTPKVIGMDNRVTEAEELMQQNKIHSLIVADGNGKLKGIIELYDLMR